MRTTVNLDDELMARAMALSGIKERAALLREALEALIHRESAARLAKLGGALPDLSVPPRRRPRSARPMKSASARTPRILAGRPQPTNAKIGMAPALGPSVQPGQRW